MSMKSWSENGYGYALNFTAEGLAKTVDFLLANDEKEVYKGKEEEMRKVEDEFDLEDAIGSPACNAIAETINRLEGCHIVAGYVSCGDTDEDAHLGICPGFPWEFTGEDKAMTKERANEIMVKYAPLLGVKEAPDYFEIEYFG